MDPNATLAEMRRLAARILIDDEHADPTRLAELTEALDEWIRNGGFLPSDWITKPA